MKTVILKTLTEWDRNIALAVSRGAYPRLDNKKRDRMVIEGVQYYPPAEVDMDLFEQILEAKRDLSDSARTRLYQIRYEDALSEMKLMGEKIGRLQSRIDHLTRCLTVIDRDASAR